MKVLEVNDNDVYGKIFNGYLIMEKLNKKDNFSVNQLVINKLSGNSNCIKLFPNNKIISMDYNLHRLEHDIMSTHSLLSTSTSFLKNNSYYKECDLVHFHQVHNSYFNLPTFLEMSKSKPTVISFHDPWFMTGRCVHPFNCDKWKNGCNNCNNLNSIFDLKIDNCNELWKIKSELANSDVDIVVHSKFMYDMAMQNPYTKNLRIHEIPLGVDISKFDFKLTKEEAKRKLNIFPSDIVIFFRAQKELKGTNFIVEALKKIKNKSNITLLTCSQKGLLKDIEQDFNIIEMGVLTEEEILQCYNAADMFLMPSLGESFGMMAVEAMASELPTIVFDNTALPETTGAPKVGILVKNLDSQDLYEKINYYINRPEERKKRGKLSKKYVSEKYNYEKYFERLEHVYKNAYQNQSYKLDINIHKDESIDFNNTNVKKITYKLNKIYNNLFPKESLPLFLQNDYLKDDKISYSDKNVINLINLFNEHVYHKFLKLNLNKEINISNNKEVNIIKSDELEYSKPLVSIIISVYNGEKYVSLAIDSALRQTYKNIEVIVVNDGSTDNTDEICKSYGEKIKYIKKENGGVSTALNLGIKNMKGEYFSWLSHDDLYYSEKISTEIEYLVKNDLIGTNTILYSNYSTIDENGKLLNNVFFDSVELNKNSAFSILKGGINGLTLLIPKKAFKEVGLFDKNLRCVQDYKLWFEMYKHNYKFVHLENVLAVTRIHSESVTNTSPKVITEGNTFWLDVIKYFTDNQKIELYGSVYNYYYNLFNFFNFGPYNEAIEYCKQKYKNIEKKNKEKMEKTKVSIIIPFNNSERFTIRAINSALNQTHNNIEMVLINNNNNDKDIENIISNNKNRIKYKKYNQKMKISEIWNEGIKLSTGDYVAFLDERSIIDVSKIEKQLTKLICSGDIISHTSYYENNVNKSIFFDSGYQNGSIIHLLINECAINLSTVMVSKEYLIKNKIKFLKDAEPAENLCFYLSVLKNNRIFGMREPLTITNSTENYQNNYLMQRKIISMVLNDDELSKMDNEVLKLLNKYIDLVGINDYEHKMDSRMHTHELERYQYFQSKEWRITQKIRKAYNKLLFKKQFPVYSLETYMLKNSKLNRLYRLCRKFRYKLK